MKVTKRGTLETGWTLQSWEFGDWVDGSTTGMIFVPFWRPKSVEYRQNTLIKQG